MLDRFSVLSDIERVLSEPPRDTRHIRWLLGKDIPILTEELDERAFLFRIQSGTNSHLLGGIAFDKRDVFHLLCGAEVV